jgi:hypothetical protein
MATPELTIRLFPALDDAPARSMLYQRELRRFEESLLALGLDVRVSIELRESGVPETLAAVVSPYLGDFMIKFAATAGPALGTLIGAWLHARYGRKVRLKIGDIEAEAQSVEEVEKLLQQAEQFQQQAQQKIIGKP